MSEADSQDVASRAQERRKPWTIAVMQPYFFPYAAYYALMAHVDEFVIYDCVQFRRRGRIHRTEVPAAQAGSLRWLTLPIEHAAQQTLIRDIRFAPGARATLDARLASLEWFARAKGAPAAELRRLLHGELPAFDAFLETCLRLSADLLEVTPRITRSTSLAISNEVRGADRVLAIARSLGATRYVNPPGGRDLYDAAHFAAAGIELAFIPDYEGPHRCMLHALMTGELAVIRNDVRAQVPQPASVSGAA